MALQIPKVEIDRTIIQGYIKSASAELYNVAKAAYGPGSSNVILGFRHGPPLFSHDGVTNLKMVRSEDPFVDDIIQAIKTASEQNNIKVGDGTTAVVILIHHLITAAQKMEGLGVDQREIVKRLNEARGIALKYIESITKPVKITKDTETYLEKVATISANDPEIGLMIADIMHEVGSDGGVVIESYEGLGVHPDIVNGFYFGQGYRDTSLINDITNNQSLHSDVPILISSRKLSTNVDLGDMIQAIADHKIKEFVLLADTSDEVAQTLLEFKQKGFMQITPVNVPFVSGSRTLFLEDIALLTGAKVFDGGDFVPSEYLGFAKEVLVTSSSTTIIGGDAENEQLKERIKIVREQVDEETNPQSIQFAKDRLARLAGKMAKIKVGGALEFERDELKLRIQDAVCAVQSAVKEGIVPGGGTTLARITGTQFDDAFKEPFKILMSNASLNPDLYLAKLSKNAWTGFDLNNITDEPIDLLENGIIDASLVAKETVRNAISTVIALIKSGAQIAQVEKD